MQAERGLEQRLDGLEREVRRLRAWRNGALVALGSVLLLSLHSPERKVVEAQEFRLVSAEGKLLGNWGSDRKAPGTGSLVIYDPSGVGHSEIIALRPHADGPELMLTHWDRKKGGAVELSADPDGGKLAIFGGCDHSSHPGLALSAMAVMSVSEDSGRIRIERFMPLEIDGQHAHASDVLLRVPDSGQPPHKH